MSKPTVDSPIVASFTGSLEIHHHWTRRIFLTDALQHLCDNGAAWLADVVASYQGEHCPQVFAESFQVWTLRVNKDHTAVVTMSDGRTEKPIIEQRLEFTDFPPPGITLLLSDEVLMIPAEY